MLQNKKEEKLLGKIVLKTLITTLTYLDMCCQDKI